MQASSQALPQGDELCHDVTEDWMLSDGMQCEQVRQSCSVDLALNPA